jgi:hypothetical protein
VKEWLFSELPETHSGNIPGAVGWSAIALAFWFVTTRITEGAWDYIPGLACYFTEWVAIGYFLRAVVRAEQLHGRLDQEIGAPITQPV